ncbi:MAG: hypothetical protein SV062_14005, partial [Thermodesulfobacteriota bacterium]|nr:hypothetical protein [Thermodesulfobacteriota bacterium]
SGARVVVFEVSGTIEINNGLWIKNPYLTIAGQTAPSPGITIKGGNHAGIVIATHDVLIQHIRVRYGDTGGHDGDALSIVDWPDENDVYNVVIDHCSFSWAVDENVSTWYDGVNNVTISNSIISECLYKSVHPKGPHSMGLLIGDHSKQISMIGNLFAHNHQRNPLIKADSSTLVVNNVIYNYGELAIHYTGPPDRPPLKSSVVGNAIIPGYNNPEGIRPVYIWNAVPVGSIIYLSDNETPGRTDDPWSIADVRTSFNIKADTPPIWTSPLTVKPGSVVKEWVLDNAGARPADRDTVDTRIVNDARNGTGRIIDSQKDVGGWPDLALNKHKFTVPKNSNGDDDGDGYTNLEEYLHLLASEVGG